MTRKPSDEAGAGGGARSAEHAPESDPAVLAVVLGLANAILKDCSIPAPEAWDAAVIAFKFLSSRVETAREEWEPIETAPKDGTRILLWVSWWNGARTEIGYWQLLRWVAHTEGGEKFPANVIKWRPLPSLSSLSVK